MEGRFSLPEATGGSLFCVDLFLFVSCVLHVSMALALAGSGEHVEKVYKWKQGLGGGDFVHCRGCFRRVLMLSCIV